MTIPIYDKSTLPCIELPFSNTHDQSLSGFGGKGFVNRVTAKCSIIAKSDTEANALYLFWRDDCKYGSEPFLADLPLFGRSMAPNNPSILCKFNGDYSMTKESSLWKGTNTITVMGVLSYIVDDQGNFVVNDAGDFTVTDTGGYVATGNKITQIRGIYG